MNKIFLTAYCTAVLLLGCAVLFAADEIQVTTKLYVQNGDFQLERDPGRVEIDQDNLGSDYHIQTIGTGSTEVVTVSADVTTNGWAWFRNVTTNEDRWVDIDVTIRMYAGEMALLRVHPTNEITAQAYTEEVKAEVWINQK